MYTLEKVMGMLKQYNLNFDIAGDRITGTLRVYCYDNGNDYATIRITEQGEVAINGRIADFENWLLR